MSSGSVSGPGPEPAFGTRTFGAVDFGAGDTGAEDAAPASLMAESGTGGEDEGTAALDGGVATDEGARGTAGAAETALAPDVTSCGAPWTTGVRCRTNRYHMSTSGMKTARIAIGADRRMALCGR